jgi:hypothetical protein
MNDNHKRLQVLVEECKEQKFSKEQTKLIHMKEGGA